MDLGDNNSTFFHNTIKERRKRLTIHKIKYQDGNWVEGIPQVAEAAIKFFEKLFSVEQTIKECVFSTDPDNALGPDDLTSEFYPSAWEVVANDVHAAMVAFFQAMTPRLESSEHLFCTGQYAQRIWQSFVGDMGIYSRNTNLREFLYKIWNFKGHKSISAYVMRSLPMIIMWEL
ncbi:hypothetical protein RDI58_024144 [Solanum bulbocastanum]|uniref:Uncharacterized protein n=1 Tax=Solanum bulbocastanum TaxID=147425 RepID=A0AAN8T157_SOLBU